MGSEMCIRDSLYTMEDHGHYVTKRREHNFFLPDDILRPVFENGYVLNAENLDMIRARVASQL